MLESVVMTEYIYWSGHAEADGYVRIHLLAWACWSRWLCQDISTSLGMLKAMFMTEYIYWSGMLESMVMTE